MAELIKMRQAYILNMVRGKSAAYIHNFFTYSTVRSATIKSIRVGIIYRVAQLAILFYIIG